MSGPLLSVNIPFPGFYNSRYSESVDWEERQFIEYETEESDSGELQHPEELRLTADEIQNLILRHTSYGIAYRSIAETYCESFDRLASESIGIPLGLKFEEMTSPREYNFQTDRIFASISLRAVRALFKKSKADGHDTLAKVIAGRFTSRSGFISYYPNTLSRWREKPLRDWDHNETRTLLIACLNLAGDSVRDLEDRIFDGIADSETVYRAWASAVDWAAFKKAREDVRDEKRRLLPSEDLESMPYFCRKPNQLFLPFRAPF